MGADDATLGILTWVSVGTGVAASALSLVMATLKPEGRKGHLVRAVIFGAFAAGMYAMQ